MSKPVHIDTFRNTEEKLRAKGKTFGHDGVTSVRVFLRTNRGTVVALKTTAIRKKLAIKPTKVFLHYDKTGKIPMDLIDIHPILVATPEIPEEFKGLPEVTYADYMKNPEVWL